MQQIQPSQHGSHHGLNKIWLYAYMDDKAAGLWKAVPLPHTHAHDLAVSL
jgi:hypothetical protein